MRHPIDYAKKEATILRDSPPWTQKASIASPQKAIRAKCLDCCAGKPSEVKLCPVDDCPLYPYRVGKNPFRKAMTEEQKEEARKRLVANRKDSNSGSKWPT